MGSVAARHVWLGKDGWLSPGELRWDTAGRLVSVRRARGAVADVAVFPGLVDAHVHLQLPPLQRPERRFDRWVRAVLSARSRVTPGELLRTAAATLRELVAAGTTAVGEIDSTGLSPRALQGLPLAGRCYQELVGFDLETAPSQRLVRARASAGTRACPGGLSPHAPYSASAALFVAAAAHRRHLAVHTAEIPEEQQLLHTGRGALRHLLLDLGRMPAGWRAPGTSAVRYLEQLGVLRPTTLLVHCQELERGDAARIRDSGAHIAVCPGTIEYFARTPPPIAQWLRLGISVALGTDSRASNASMSMRDELRAACRLWPELPAATLLTMATAAGGAALGRPGLGHLWRGGRADFVCAAAGALPREGILREIVHGDRPFVATFLAGKRVHGAPAGRSC